MIGRIFNWMLGRGGARRREVAAGRRSITARFDIAQTNSDNAGYWLNADNLSARAANSPAVRRIIRARARHEVANNSYARGIVNTLADDLIGTGPRLQIQTGSHAANQAIEKEWRAWSKAIRLGRKLRILRISRAMDGEAFAHFVTNRRLQTPVQLDLKLLEAEQVSTPLLAMPDKHHEDGLTLDDDGNIVAYHVLKAHPGESFLGARMWETDEVPATQMLHLYRDDRPGQVRGISELAPGLQVLAELRRYCEATIGAAETAADHAAVLTREGSAEDEDPLDPLLEIPITRKVLTAMPVGWTMQQLKAEHPIAAYDMFVNAKLQEIGRCLNMPFNVVAGNSATLNYSSSRFDGAGYVKRLKCDGEEFEAALDRIFEAWIAELLLTDVIPPGALAPSFWTHAWVWDAREFIDPKGEVDSAIAQIEAGLLTDAAYFASRGLDWREVYEQRALERRERIRLGIATEADLANEAAAAAATPATPPAGANDAEASAEETDEPPEIGVGELAGLSRQQLQRNLKAIDDVLDRLDAGDYTELRARAQLRALGLSREFVEDLLSDLDEGVQAGRRPCDIRAEWRQLYEGEVVRVAGRRLTIAASGADRLSRIRGASDGTTCRIEAAAEPTEADDGARRITLCAYTGGLLHIAKWDLPLIIDLDGLEIPQPRLPCLVDHRRGAASILGQLDEIEIRDGKVYASGRVYGTSPEVQRVVDLGVRGYVWQASIGADCDAADVEEVAEGETVFVNGQELVGPAYVARRSVLNEISVVTIGGDSQTSAVIAAGAGEMDFDAYVQSLGLDPANLSDELRAILQAQFDAQAAADAADEEPAEDAEAAADDGSDDEDEDPNKKPAPAAGKKPPVQAGRKPGAAQGGATRRRIEQGADVVRDIRAIATKETKRINAIRRIAKGHATIEAQAIEGGWSAMQTELAVLRKSRPEGVARPGTSPSPDAARLEIEAMATEAALLVAAKVPINRVGKLFGGQHEQQIMNIAASRDMRGVTLHELFHRRAAAAGMKLRVGQSLDDSIIRHAIKAERREIQADGGLFSTVSLSGLLSNVANKSMIDSFTETAVVWPEVCAERSHKDFKPTYRYRLDQNGNFKEIPATGEFEHSQLSEAEYVNRLKTYGTMIALNRQMIVNDDLGAFTQIPKLMGRQGTLRIEEAFAKLWCGNVGTFFAASGVINYFEGADTALSIDALTRAKQLCMDMVDSSGKPILVAPEILLVPSSLKTLAESLCSEREIVAGTSTSKQTKNNPHAGTLKAIATPYLNNTAIRDQDGAAISGQSAVAWGLLLPPSVRAALAVAFLNGQRTPTIESDDTVFNTLGMQWRAYHDFGVAFEEKYAAVKSKGSA